MASVVLAWQGSAVVRYNGWGERTEIQMREQQTGIAAGVTAYVLWGFLPLYWKLFNEVPAIDVLAHRVIWSFLFMAVLIVLIGRSKGVWNEITHAFHSVKTTAAITGAALLITINWFTFIFAVNGDHVIQASLGYYINPLVNVALATVFLKERLARMEIAAVALAFIGVFVLTISYGQFPWASVILALSFGCYGIIKKTVALGAWAGLTLESFLAAPFALIFLMFFSGETASTYDSGTWTLLFGAGAVTAVPLLLFASGARKISYSLLGFLQYIAPTIMLALGVFLFREPFSIQQFTAFLIVWAGLTLFTVSRTRIHMQRKKTEAAINN